MVCYYAGRRIVINSVRHKQENKGRSFFKNDPFFIWSIRFTGVILIFVFFFISCTPSTEEEKNSEAIKQEILSLLPVQSEKQIGIIFTKYTLTYLPNKGESLPQIEELILESAPLNYTVNILTIIIKNNIFNSFTDKLFDQLKTNMKTLKGKQALLARQLVYLYPAVRLYYKKTNKTKDEWLFIRDSLVSSKEIRPISLYDTALLDAYKQLKNKKQFFQLKAYKYFNEEDLSLIKLFDLYYNYFLINEKKESFENEFEIVKSILKIDIKRYAVIDSYLPIKDEYFKDAEKNEKTLLSYTKQESFLYNRKAVIIFFSLTCGYCKQVFESLLKVLKDNPQYHEKAEIFGIKLPLHKKLSFMNNLHVYKNDHNITIPLYENDESDVFSRLNVMSIPRIYFLNENGRIIQIIQFSAYGHLDQKLRWFFDDFLQ